MTKRVEALEFMAAATGETFVTMDNYARVMAAPHVPAPYNTTLGRGKRHARVDAYWLCSTHLSQLLADPKSSAERVPLCGEAGLIETQMIWRQTKVDGNPLDYAAARTETTYSNITPSSEAWLGGTLFEALVVLVSLVARNWNGPMHKEMHEGFKLTINTGTVFSADLELFQEKTADGGSWWTNSRYVQESSLTEGEVFLSPSTLAPIQRQVVIRVEHIQMLAALYAGTLQHEGVLPLAPSLKTAPAPAAAGAETKTPAPCQEPASSDCQPTVPVINDDTHTQANGRNNRGSNPCVCVSTSGKSVRAGAATSNRRRQYALAPHHHASA